MALMNLPTICDQGFEEGMEDVEISEESKVCAQLFSMLKEIKDFMRTPEEGVNLVWKIVEESIKRTAASFTRGYNSQTVVEEIKTYGGRATEDAPDDEVQAAFKDAEGC